MKLHAKWHDHESKDLNIPYCNRCTHGHNTWGYIAFLYYYTIVWARIPTSGQTVTADHSRMGSAMMLSLRCFSPPGVRSSLFLKVDQCFYALVVGSVVPRGESTAFLCLGVMNDKVVKEHYGTRALSTCPPPSKEAVNLEGSVVTMGARWFKGYVAHIQPQLIVGFSWANFDLPRVLASQVGLQQNWAELFTRPFSVGWYLFGCDGVDRASMETHFMLTKGRSG